TTPTMQHAVMIEAVENHMPQVIVIDEIGTELEAQAARTIAERGVQLVGTAHGNTLENLMMNPTLADLIGGIQSVTLSDEEARRRHTQKSVLERKSAPTFDIVVEIQGWDRVAIHTDVGAAVDAILRGQLADIEVRQIDENGEVKVEHIKPDVTERGHAPEKAAPVKEEKVPRLYLFGVNRIRVEQTAREMHLPVEIVSNLEDANLMVTSKNYFRRKPQRIRDAESSFIPIHVLRNNTPQQVRQLFYTLYHASGKRETDDFSQAMTEAEEAVAAVKDGRGSVELSPQSAYIRRLQHLVAESNHLPSQSTGKDPNRRVRIYRE
ncbi:MAG: single-stranded DNA-binding protein, partial [Dehalococcoidales bacterium]|nr:single-stranded DNA-binding protein [Dehalococcoidales bacterium]